jgi:hydroxymethylbilane synthase
VALQEKRVSFVVHSLKDLPTILPDNMIIGAVCRRDDPRDAVVMHPKYAGQTLQSLPHDCVIGTSSLRRGAQLRKACPHLQIKDVRGNLNTRLRKLDDANDYSCLVLAKAGLDRMGWQSRASQVLNEKECMYAVSQGAMAVECLEDDLQTIEMLRPLHHTETVMRVVAERAFLRTLEGGCSVPVAVHTEVVGSTLRLCGGVFSTDGEQSVVDSMVQELPTDMEPNADMINGSANTAYSSIVATYINPGAMATAENLGQDLAKRMISAGADVILKKAKSEAEHDIRQRAAARQPGYANKPVNESPATETVAV